MPILWCQFLGHPVLLSLFVILNCTSFHVHVDPRLSVINLTVTYVNETSVQLSWSAPSMSHGHNSYRVECVSCESTVTFTPNRERLNSTTSVPPAVILCSSKRFTITTPMNFRMAVLILSYCIYVYCVYIVSVSPVVVVVVCFLLPFYLLTLLLFCVYLCVFFYIYLCISSCFMGLVA